MIRPPFVAAFRAVLEVNMGVSPTPKRRTVTGGSRATSLQTAKPTAGTAAAPLSLRARTQRLEDLEEIRRLLVEYGQFLDMRDFRAYAALFAEDGEWVGGFGTARGPAAIQAMMEKHISAASGNIPGKAYHLLSNFVIDLDGDRASAWSRWTFVGELPDNKTGILCGGHYDDSLVLEQGHWKFKRRVAVLDMPQLG